MENRLDLTSLIMGFSSAALSYMGYDEDSEMKNITLARQNIDIIELLKEKCEGNLSPEEDELIAKILPDLKKKYIEACGHS